MIIVFLAVIPLAAALIVGTRDVDHSRLTMLDVGQGDSILLRSPGYAVLVDAGGRSMDDHFGESRLLPMLVDRGVRTIDVAVLTHVHPDHCGGLPSVLQHLKVRSMWISPRRFRGDCARAVLAACAAREVPIHLLRDGDTRRLGGITITAELPDRTFKRSPENNSSVVLKVLLGGRTALLTGDMERDAEEALARRTGKATILKVGHHGSRTSTSSALLAAARPAIALISCGRGNLFGHPHATVIDRLRARAIRIWRTDRNSTVDVDVRSAHVFVQPEVDTPR